MFTDKIKVGKKYYTEAELLRYIDYFNEHYRLPDVHDDLKAEILKSVNSYPQISKSTYRPNLYYEQYCDLKINYKEIETYVLENPDYFHFYVFDNVFLYVYIKNNNNIEKLEYDSYDREFKYTIYENVNQQEIIDILNIIKNLINNLRMSFYIDILSMKNIYNKRIKCIEYNPNYTKNMIMKHLDELPSPKKLLTQVDVYTHFLTTNYVELNLEILHDEIPDNYNDYDGHRFVIQEHVGNNELLINDNLDEKIEELKLLL